VSTTAVVTSEQVLRSLRLPSRGQIYDLDPGRFTGMPIWAGHPPFQIVSYRTPRGLRIQRDQQWLAPEVNEVNIGLLSELVIATCHSGAHMDALAHISCGPDNHWHGGVTDEEALGDFGPTQHDASAMPPIIARGVLVDLPRHLHVQRLRRSYPISLAEFQATLEAQGVALRAGDVAVVRTGQMSVWPDREEMAKTQGAGITRPIADMAVDLGLAAVGTDTEACEVMPSIDSTNPHPVHQRLLIEAGIHIVENLFLERLAADSVYEFLFLALPPKITGATGAMIRPIAIA